MDFFDLHCDSPYESLKQRESFINGDLAVTVEKGSVFNCWRQVCAVWVPDEHKAPKERYREITEHFKCQVDIATSREALESQTAFLLSLEGGAVIERLEDVDMLYRDGVRVITLTWNGKNKIAGGANTASPLTDFGRRVIERMNSLNIAVDVSHLNDLSFFDVVDSAQHVLATHSCCRDVYHVRRNMTDAQIRAVARKSGIIGLCLYPKFLGEGDTLSNFYLHLMHLLSMGLEDNVAVGSDFDGAKMDKRLDAVDKMAVLYNYLKDEGLSEELLHKLFYKNAQDYFCALLN